MKLYVLLYSILFCCIAFGVGVLQAEMLCGFEYMGPPEKSRLVAFDVISGEIVGTSYFPVTNAYMQGAAFDDASNTLYAWDAVSDSLCTVDITTGLPNIIGRDEELLEEVRFSSLAINPVTNDMFGMTYLGDLYKVNMSNGNLTHIGKVSSLAHVHGFTFSPDGVAYCSDTTSSGSNIFMLDTTNAEASLVASLSQDYIIALDFDKNGTLYGADNGTDRLGIIDISKGDWTEVGNVHDITSMAFSIIPEPANHPPVADAGQDQTVYVCIDEIAEVTLDGSGSNDIDSDEFTYYWSWMIGDEIYDANGVALIIELPVGEHVIELVVNDGIEDSEPNEVIITVIDSIELLVILADYIIDLNLHAGIENSLLAKIGTAIGKLEDDNDKNDKAAATSLQAFINAVEAQSGKKILQEDADYLIGTAQQAIDISSCEQATYPKWEN